MEARELANSVDERRKPHAFGKKSYVTAVLVLAIAGLVGVVAGVFSGSATALSVVDAQENINSADVSIGYSADFPGDGTWTNLGSVTLTPGSSYVVSAVVGLRETGPGSGGVAATGECALSLPNEPEDTEDASLVGAKGESTANLNFEGLTQLIAAGGYNISGSANLLCRSTSPGAAGMIIASDARVIAVPVDGVQNNLHTFRCPEPGVYAPPC